MDVDPVLELDPSYVKTALKALSAKQMDVIVIDSSLLKIAGVEATLKTELLEAAGNGVLVLGLDAHSRVANSQFAESAIAASFTEPVDSQVEQQVYTAFMVGDTLLSLEGQVRASPGLSAVLKNGHPNRHVYLSIHSHENGGSVTMRLLTVLRQMTYNALAGTAKDGAASYKSNMKKLQEQAAATTLQLCDPHGSGWGGIHLTQVEVAGLFKIHTSLMNNVLRQGGAACGEFEDKAWAMLVQTHTAHIHIHMHMHECKLMNTLRQTHMHASTKIVMHAPMHAVTGQCLQDAVGTREPAGRLS